MKYNVQKQYYGTFQFSDDGSGDGFIILPEELIEESGWNESTILSTTVRLGEKGNVLVIKRCDRVDNGIEV